MLQLEFEAIGTYWHIDLDTKKGRLQNISSLIAKRIEDFDLAYSRFRPDSWVSQVGQNPGRHKVPADFKQMFQFYQKLYQLTDGLVTPLIGDAMERAGYDANYSLKPKALHKIPSLNETLEFKSDTLHVKYSCVLDFGAAGKGYLVDIIGELLVEQGITHFTIDAGGDILHHSPAQKDVLRIGLEDPSDTSQVIGVVNLSSALCGSAGNRRAWDSYNHIINPKTLKSETRVAATWVVADSAMVADGLATALFFVEPRALTNFDFEYVVLSDTRQSERSANFPGELFKA